MVENSDKGDEEKPEPEEEVKLLVDNIVRENTDGYSRSGMASSAVLGEGASGYNRQCSHHWFSACLVGKELNQN